MRTRGSSSGGDPWAGRLAAFLVGGLLPLLAGAQETKLFHVDVTFRITEARYRIRLRDRLGDLQTEARKCLVQELARRFPYIGFESGGQADHVLTGTLDTDRVLAGEAPDPLRPDPVSISFSFERQGPGGGRPRSAPWSYRPLSSFWHPLPMTIEEFQDEIRAYLGGAAAPDSAESRADVDSRYRVLFQRILQPIPLFPEQAIEHLGGTPFLVVNPRRSEFERSVPGDYLFRLIVNLPEEAGAEARGQVFLARALDGRQALDHPSVRNLSPQPPALTTGLVLLAEGPAPGSRTGVEHLRRLSGSGPHEVRRPVTLFDFERVTAADLTTSPEEFQPGS